MFSPVPAVAAGCKLTECPVLPERACVGSGDAT